MSCFDREIKSKQGSDEWFESRMGVLTGSIVSDIITGSRGGYPVSREKLLYKKVIELQCSVNENEDIPQKYADWGHEHEAEACQLVNGHPLLEGKKLVEVGLIKSDFSEYVGSSLDRISDDGKVAVEVKCPFYMSSHIAHYFNKPALNLTSTSKNYYWQIRHHMLVTGAEVGLWASFHYKYLPNPIFIDVVERDEKEMDFLKSECLKFVDELRTMAKALL